MNPLQQWAAVWNISPEAIADLMVRICPEAPHGNPKTLEAQAQRDIRIEASRRGMRLFRNNNGACTNVEGRVIRYGLGNDSPQMSKILKSSDLIGITPVTAGGRTFGVFTSIEVKRPGWTFRGSDREVAQAAWITLINGMGGIAKFATSKEDL